jgi:hypothetical protein
VALEWAPFARAFFLRHFFYGTWVLKMRLVSIVLTVLASHALGSELPIGRQDALLVIDVQVLSVLR